MSPSLQGTSCLLERQRLKVIHQPLASARCTLNWAQNGTIQEALHTMSTFRSNSVFCVARLQSLQIKHIGTASWGEPNQEEEVDVHSNNGCVVDLSHDMKTSIAWSSPTYSGPS